MRNPNPKAHEKLILGETKLLQVQPTQMKAIIDNMMDGNYTNETVNFEQFKLWLDKNPDVRVIIKDVVKP